MYTIKGEHKNILLCSLGGVFFIGKAKCLRIRDQALVAGKHRINLVLAAMYTKCTQLIKLPFQNVRFATTPEDIFIHYHIISKEELFFYYSKGECSRENKRSPNHCSIKKKKKKRL